MSKRIGEDGAVKARRVLRRMWVGVVDVRVPIWGPRVGSSMAKSRDNRSADSFDFVKMRETGILSCRERAGVGVAGSVSESESESESELESNVASESASEESDALSGSADS